MKTIVSYKGDFPQVPFFGKGVLNKKGEIESLTDPAETGFVENMAVPDIRPDYWKVTDVETLTKNSQDELDEADRIQAEKEQAEYDETARKRKERFVVKSLKPLFDSGEGSFEERIARLERFASAFLDNGIL